MYLYLVTPCGRYGKCHGEPFLRRRSTLEPMDTPRRYYEAEANYQEGQILSAAAWERWRREKFGDEQVSRSPWFELVDQELREINNLVQSSDDEGFHLGLRKLQQRVAVSEQAESNIVEVGNSASKEERERWQLLVRAGPPLLATISRYLGSESGREEGKEKLFNLCDDGIVSRTIRGPPIPCRSQTSTSIAHREDQADTGTERTETRRAISQLNQISPPSTGSPESFQRSRTTGRPSSIAERSHVPSRTQSTGSPISARTTSRPTTIRQARPPSSRPAESGRPTVRPPLPSGSRPSAHFHARPPTGVAIRDFAVGAGNETAQPARPLPPNQIAAPADASPQTALYMAGRGTASPTYISPSKFFAEHGEEHGLERPPAYATEAPSTPAAAQFIPRQRAGEDLEAIAMEGRHGMWRMRSTHAPSSIPRAQNGIGGGEAERN